MKQDQYPDIPNLHWQGNVHVKISYIRFLRNEIKTDQKKKKIHHMNQANPQDLQRSGLPIYSNSLPEFPGSFSDSWYSED